MNVYERTTHSLHQAEAIQENNQVYLSSAFLTESLGLTRKVLSDNSVGICLEDLCIPMSTDERSQIIQNGGEEYVAMNYFIDALGGTLINDTAEKTLLLDFQQNNSGAPVQSDKPADFTLPSLQGEPVSLSDYRGKRVVMFAWASW